MAFARTVVESAEVSTLLDAETKRHERLQDLFDGLKWRIARDPEAGYSVPGTRPALCVIRSDDALGLPVLVLAYTFDADQVVVIGARVEGAEAAAASIKLA
jgi:hypothetical protein